MHDGQNLFDNLTSFSGEWQIDETLNNLHQNGNYGAIVVGIDNGGSERINEYGPWNNPQYGGGQGNLYMDFIIETLKPYIDANFRTKPQAPYTAMIGSSLGALISTYGQVRFSTTFEKIGSFSPAYWFNLTDLSNYVQNTTSSLSNARYYFVAGQNESSTMVTNINTIRGLLQSKGLSSNNTFTKIDSYGTHTESYWRGEFSAAYQWLFATTPLSNETTTVAEKTLVQLSKNEFYTKGIDTTKTFELIDVKGQKIKLLTLQEGLNTLSLDLPAGIYFLKGDDIRLKIYQ
jgi:alpha-glucosidase